MTSLNENKIYRLRVFHKMSTTHCSFASVKIAYKMANRAYRKLNTCVVLENLITKEILYSRCSNDFAFDQWYRWLEDKPNVFNRITKYQTI